MPHPRLARLTLAACLGFLTLVSNAASSTPPGLSWIAHEGFRVARLPPASGSIRSSQTTRFTELSAPQSGITWTQQISSARYTSRQNMMNGAGLALADFDGDGWCDVFLCGKEGPSALYRNLGAWRFEDVTSQAGVSCPGMIATGAAVGDVNGDGRPDLHVTSFLGPDALFLNLGGFRFTNVTTSAGLVTTGGNTSSVFADVDGDGDLDLYLCRFGVEAILRDGARITTRMVGGVPVPSGRFARRLQVVNGQLVELGEADVLFLNQGQGTFRAAPWAEHFFHENGRPFAEAPLDFSLAAQFRDFNDDGVPDLYVCSDFQTPDRLWLGQGDGTFRAAPSHALRTISSASMGVDAADIDRDGRLDFVTVEMLSLDPRRTLAQAPSVNIAPSLDTSTAEVPRNVLQWNRGDGTYAEIAWFAGVAASDWSWTPIFIDVDLDGYQDLLVSNGHPHDLNDLDVAAALAAEKRGAAGETARSFILRYPPLTPPKVAWRNLGNLRFEDRSSDWGFQSTRITHGLALGDLDNDGDADVVGNVWRDAPLLYRNDSPESRIAVRLRPRTPHSEIGARVRLLGGAVPVQELEVLGGGRYLSSDHPQLTFAQAASNAAPATLVVHWRSGAVSTVQGVQRDLLYEIAEPPASPGRHKDSRTPDAHPSPWFTSPRIDLAAARHHPGPSTPAAQPLLPWRLDRPGPAVAVAAEGTHSWLMITRGRDAHGAMAPAVAKIPKVTGPLSIEWSYPSLPPGTPEVAAVAFAHLRGREHGLTALASLAPSMPSARDTANSPSVLLWELTNGQWIAQPSLPSIGAAAGPMALGDLDADGDLDLAVGGRWIPGRYPHPAPVVIFTNHLGHLSRDDARSRPLANVGLVTGLAFANLDDEPTPELVTSCEWGPLRLWRLGPAQPSAISAPPLASLEHATGLWQCITMGDFDGDGRTDIAAGNWGLNSAWQRAPDGPWTLAFGEFAAPGIQGLVEAWTLRGEATPRPRRRRDVLQSDLPWLAGKFSSHQKFAEASLDALFEGLDLPPHRLAARNLASAVFLNRVDRWERVDLPAQAQWTPIHHLAAADLDGNGTLDLVCAQNHFSTRADDERIDAGCGLVLLNDGRARFHPLPALQAGLDAQNEQRGVAIADLNADHHADLIMTETGNAPRLWLANPARSRQ